MINNGCGIITISRENQPFFWKINQFLWNKYWWNRFIKITIIINCDIILKKGDFIWVKKQKRNRILGTS